MVNWTNLVAVLLSLLSPFDQSNIINLKKNYFKMLVRTVFIEYLE